MDETLLRISEKVKNFAAIYVVDITQTPDFNQMYVVCFTYWQALN